MKQNVPTREEALRRWNESKKLKRKMAEKLERLARRSAVNKSKGTDLQIEVL